jgi:tripartite-type tricarboxylate transporter receptor subunit TctC
MIQFDVEKDIAPISLLAATPVVVVSGPGGDLETLDGLIAAARATPGEVPYGSSGMGTAMHLTAELFQRQTETELLHIPYAGVAPAVTDLLGGQIPLGFFDVTSVLPHRENPDIHILAVAGPERAPQLPDTPTLTESGIPVNGVIWYGLVAPAGIPDEVLDKLESAAVVATKTETFSTSLSQLGFYALPTGHSEMQTVMQHDREVWLPIIEQEGISAR